MRLLTLGVALLVSTPVDAQIRVDVPAHCGSQEQFARALDQLLGRPFEQPLDVTVRITERQARYQLEVESADSRRVLEDSSCDALFSAAVLMVAVDVGFVQDAPASLPRAAPSTAELVPAQAAATEPAPRPSPPKQPSRRAHRPESAPARALFLTAGAGVALGPVPHVAARFELGTGAQFGPVSLTASGHFITPREASERAGERVRIHGFGAALLGGVRAFSWLTLALGPELSVLRGRVSQDDGGQDVAVAFAPRAELSLALSRGRTELALVSGASYFARRPRFVTPEAQTLFRAPTVAVAFGLRGRFQFL